MDAVGEIISAEGMLKCVQTSMFSIEYAWILENFEPLISGRNTRRSPAFCPMLNIPVQFYFQIECEKRNLHIAETFYIFSVECSVTLKSVGIIPINRNVMIETKMIRGNNYDKSCEPIEHQRKIVDFLNNRNLQCLYFTEKIKDDFTLNLSKNMVVIKSHLHFLDGPIFSPVTAEHLTSFDCACYTKHLAEDLKTIMNDSFLSDITVKVGQTMFKAHKAILAARSPVFKMMIEHDCLESKTGIINIKECDSNIFTPFFEYLYTGNLGNENFETVLSLFEMADMYDVRSLRNSCFEVITLKLTSGDFGEVAANVCKTLQLAQRHGEGKLKQVGIQFIIRHFKEMVAQKEWHDFVLNDFQLASEIFVVLSSIYNSIDIVKPFKI